MVFWIQNSDFSTRIASLYGSLASSVVFACKTASFEWELQVSMGPRLRLSFCSFKTATLAPELQVSLCSSPHLWFCAFTTATLWLELIVSIGPRSHLSFCACKTAWLAPELQVSMGPRTHQSFCAWKTMWLASELLVSMGPSLHLWFLRAKQRLSDQNYKSLWVPDFTMVFWIQNSDISNRIASLYRTQASSVFFACKTATFGLELQVSMGPRLRLSFCSSKTT